MNTQTIDRQELSPQQRVALSPFSEVINREGTKILACPDCDGVTFWNPGVRFLLTSNLGLNPRFDSFGHDHAVLICTNPSCQSPVANIDGTYYNVKQYLSSDKVREILSTRFSTVDKQ